MESLTRQSNIKNPFPARMVDPEILEGHQQNEALVEIIQEDPRLTAQVLRRANSALYCRGIPIESIEESVIRLGYNTLRDIMLSCFVEGFYQEYPVPRDKIPFVRNLFDHSVGTALIAKAISAKLPSGPRKASAAYTVGLLHHLGLYLLATRLSDYLDQVSLIFRSQELNSWVEAEEVYLGTDHAETGGMLLRLWNLPPSIYLGVGWHHKDGAGSESPHHINHTVRIASFIANTPEGNDPVFDIQALGHSVGAWAEDNGAYIRHLHSNLGGLRGRLSTLSRRL